MKNFAIKLPKTTSVEKANEVKKILGIDICLTKQDYIILFKDKGEYELFDSKSFPKQSDDVIIHLCRNDRSISRNVIKDLDIWKATKAEPYIPTPTPIICDYNEVTGNIITMTKDGLFDVITYGINCHSRMRGGLSKQMVDTFGTDKFPMEDPSRIGDATKLGEIDWMVNMDFSTRKVAIVNSYIQNWPWQHGSYKALRNCLNKINKVFHGKHIGLPQIGCNIAEMDWKIVKEMIQKELVDCKVTVVVFDQDTK